MLEKVDGNSYAYVFLREGQVISLNSDWLFKAKIVRVYIEFITYVEANI